MLCANLWKSITENGKWGLTGEATNQPIFTHLDDKLTKEGPKQMHHLIIFYYLSITYAFAPLGGNCWKIKPFNFLIGLRKKKTEKKRNLPSQKYKIFTFKHIAAQFSKMICKNICVFYEFYWQYASRTFDLRSETYRVSSMTKPC